MQMIFGKNINESIKKKHNNFLKLKSRLVMLLKIQRPEKCNQSRSYEIFLKDRCCNVSGGENSVYKCSIKNFLLYD